MEKQLYTFYQRIAWDLSNDLLIQAYGIAYHCWQMSGHFLEEDPEVEAYKGELMKRLEPME